MSWCPSIDLHKTDVLDTGMEVAVLAGGRRLALLFFSGQVDLNFVPVWAYTKSAGASASWVRRRLIGLPTSLFRASDTRCTLGGCLVSLSRWHGPGTRLCQPCRILMVVSDVKKARPGQTYNVVSCRWHSEMAVTLDAAPVVGVGVVVGLTSGARWWRRVACGETGETAAPDEAASTP